MSFRNRCIVAGANGPVSLSIPLEKGREQKQNIMDVKLANQYPWQEQHWKTIQSCYSRSPWFEYYRDELLGFYKTPYEYLWQWDTDLFSWTIKKLDADIMTSVTPAYQKSYGPDKADWRNRILPKNYSSFPVPGYQQVFLERTGFLPNLSVLDLLFCKGKQARHYLQNDG